MRKLLFSSILFCSLSCAGTVTLPLTPGWDDFFPLQSGSVVRTLTGDSLSLTFTVTAAQLEGLLAANQQFQLAFDIFGQSSPGVSYFGLPRTVRATYIREGNTNTVDVFLPGTLTTDANGNGTAVTVLDLTGVPAGSYELEYVIADTVLHRGHVVYRTGSEYGVGLDRIDIAAVPEPAQACLAGILLGAFFVARRAGRPA